jgi:hypothetical protein
MDTEGSVPKNMFPEGYIVCEQGTKAKILKRVVKNCEHASVTSCECRYASLNDRDMF